MNHTRYIWRAEEGKRCRRWRWHTQYGPRHHATAATTNNATPHLFFCKGRLTELFQVAVGALVGVLRKALTRQEARRENRVRREASAKHAASAALQQTHLDALLGLLLDLEVDVGDRVALVNPLFNARELLELHFTRRKAAEEA